MAPFYADERLSLLHGAGANGGVVDRKTHARRGVTLGGVILTAGRERSRGGGVARCWFFLGEFIFSFLKTPASSHRHHHHHHHHHQIHSGTSPVSSSLSVCV
jgi:hypothetical protein